MSSCRLGFAVGCEARALPRRPGFFWLLGYAPSASLAPEVLWQSQNQGAAQFSAGAKRRGRARASHPAAKPRR